jgi:cyclopropane fatty-acyl-phospholipid synthase-like methyltransferase
MKAYSEACDRNREPILAVLRDAYADCTRVLEIGSGTGQHAVHFAAHLPHLIWQTSERPEHHAGMLAWIAESNAANVRPPLALDVNQDVWNCGDADAVFTSNTLHIMSWVSVQAFFRGVTKLLSGGGVIAIYGPFKYEGRHTSDSNARFDAFLRERDPASGVRDFEAVDTLARDAGLMRLVDKAMPANNRLLVWSRAVGAPSS